MNKKELAAYVSDYLRENDIRKPIRVEKNTFRITDSDGNVADFTVKQRDKTAIYTVDDVSNILDACITVVEDALKRGDSISLRGFGSLCLHYRAPRRIKEPKEDIWHTVDGHYVPKFYPGKELKLAARMFELNMDEQDAAPKLPDPVYDEYD